MMDMRLIKALMVQPPLLLMLEGERESR